MAIPRIVMSLATLMVTAQALSMSIPRLISTKDSPSLSGLDRRHFLSATSMALPIALVSSKAVADETSPQQFTDERFGVSFDVPAGWQRQDSSLETAKYMGTDRRLVLYVAPGDPDTNVFAVFTPIRGDYTAVSSFGTLEQVALTVVPRGPGIESALLDSAVKGGNYYFNYEIQPGPEEPKRRLKTIFSIAHSSTTDMLVTFTAQSTGTKDDAALKASLDSFKVRK